MRKLIVVTGGSQGIGRAILAKFIAEGFDGVTCARNADALASLKTDLEKMNPGSTVFFRACDLAVKTQVDSFTQYVKALNRPVEVLVNNAGYFVPGEIATEPDGNLESMIGANLYSAYHTTRGLVGGMKTARAGHIFNMCSIASVQAYPNGGSYAISKAALLGFSRCLREELKEYNVRVTAILPGATRTRSWEASDLPEDRFMKVEDVADTVFHAYNLSARSVVEEILIRPQLGDI